MCIFLCFTYWSMLMLQWSEPCVVNLQISGLNPVHMHMCMSMCVGYVSLARCSLTVYTRCDQYQGKNNQLYFKCLFPDIIYCISFPVALMNQSLFHRFFIRPSSCSAVSCPQSGFKQKNEHHLRSEEQRETSRKHNRC